MTAWCYGYVRAHEVATPLSEDHLCLSCAVNLAHELDQREGL